MISRNQDLDKHITFWWNYIHHHTSHFVERSIRHVTYANGQIKPSNKLYDEYASFCEHDSSAPKHLLIKRDKFVSTAGTLGLPPQHPFFRKEP